LLELSAGLPDKPKNARRRKIAAGVCASLGMFVREKQKGREIVSLFG
jgi:hypothetical protein